MKRLLFLVATLLTIPAAAQAVTDRVLAQYEVELAPRLVPMLTEVLRFPTYEGNTEAHAAQKAWLMKKAAELGFTARDAGKITEIELPATSPGDAPVLGLVIHGDVQTVDEASWSFPPFKGLVQDGHVLGRGAADDKGPLIQALLAMKALADSGVTRTHTIRLLVGSEEESGATEMAEYLETHTAPGYSLVLDSEFPVVVGEKAWDGLGLRTTLAERGTPSLPYRVSSLSAGLAPSIVPDRAEIVLEWREGTADWTSLSSTLARFKAPEGTRLELTAEENRLTIVAHGRAAHSGVNPRGGRNALVALARAMEGRLPAGGANDLLSFARLAGKDLTGGGLGISDRDPVWGQYTVNVATILPPKDDASLHQLYINVRRIPPRTAGQMKAHLLKIVSEFNAKTGAKLTYSEVDSWFQDEPLSFDTNAPLVKRLMNLYSRATGESRPPAISGGGTYAKRLPNSIAFGMWFPGQPYPGHDRDEKISIRDLQRGARVLVYALADIATGRTIEKPFGR